MRRILAAIGMAAVLGATVVACGPTSPTAQYECSHTFLKNCARFLG